MRSVGARPDSSTRAWRDAVFGIFWLEGFVFASWVTRIPETRALLHVGTTGVSALIVAIAVGSLGGLLASGYLVGRFGATHTILVACSAQALALAIVGVILAFAPNFIGVAMVLVIFGAGQSIADVAMNLSGVANERVLKRTVLPLFHAMYSLGTACGAALGALSLWVGVPVFTHLVAVAAFAVVAVQVLVRRLQPAGQEHRSLGQAAGAMGQRLAVWKDPRVLMIGLIAFGMSFAEGGANDWLGLSMVEGYGLTGAGGATVFAVFVSSVTVARAAGPGLLDRFGRVLMLRTSAAMAGVGVLLVMLGGVLPVALVGTVLWGFGCALGFPVGISAAADNPRTATASVSVVTTLGYSAFLVGPPIIGFVGNNVGLLHAFSVVVLLALAAGVAAGAARPRSATSS